MPTKQWLFEEHSVDKNGRPYCIVANDAYGAYLRLISPWPGQFLEHRSPYKDAFNYFFSGGKRNIVERLFGVTYQRWGILWRPILYKLTFVPIIMLCICRLHNFLVDVKDMENIPSLGSGMGYFGRRKGYHGGTEKLRTHDRPSGYDDNVHPQDECALEDGPQQHEHPTLQDRNNCSTRVEITNYLQTVKQKRPDYSRGRLNICNTN